MPRLKNHLPIRARNHKIICALGQDLHALAYRAVDSGISDPGSIPARFVTLVTAVTRASSRRLSGSAISLLKITRARGVGVQKRGSDVTNQSAIGSFMHIYGPVV